MLKKFLIFCLVAGACVQQLSAEELVHKSFDVKPEIVHTKVMRKIKHKGKQEVLDSSIRLHTVKNQSFHLEFKLTNHVFFHYAPVTFGFRGKSGQALSLRFFRSKDFRINSSCRPGKGQKEKAGQKNLPYLSSEMTVQIQYFKEKRQAVIKLLGKNGNLLAEFTHGDIGELELDSFYIEGLRCKDVGTVWYDPDKRNLFVRSVANAKFRVEMSVDDLILKF